MNKHNPQRASRTELARRLDIIRLNMTTLLRLFPDTREFHNEFASFAADITARASAQDEAWASDQLKQILTEYGVGSCAAEVANHLHGRR